jgi:hypothetical protein
MNLAVAPRSTVNSSTADRQKNIAKGWLSIKKVPAEMRHEASSRPELLEDRPGVQQGKNSLGECATQIAQMHMIGTCRDIGVLTLQRQYMLSDSSLWLRALGHVGQGLERKCGGLLCSRVDNSLVCDLGTWVPTLYSSFLTFS